MRSLLLMLLMSLMASISAGECLALTLSDSECYDYMASVFIFDPNAGEGSENCVSESECTFSYGPWTIATEGDLSVATAGGCLNNCPADMTKCSDEDPDDPSPIQSANVIFSLQSQNGGNLTYGGNFALTLDVFGADSPFSDLKIGGEAKLLESWNTSCSQTFSFTNTIPGCEWEHYNAEMAIRTGRTATCDVNVSATLTFSGYFCSERTVGNYGVRELTVSGNVCKINGNGGKDAEGHCSDPSYQTYCISQP